MNVQVEQCPICLDEMDEMNDNYCITDCNHVYCKGCLDELIEQNVSICSLCRNDIKFYKNRENINHIIKINNNVETTEMRNTIVNNNNIYRKRLYYYQFLLFIMFLYNIDQFYGLMKCNNNLYTMNNLYHNCTENLENKAVTDMNIINSLEKGTSQLNVFYEGILRMCSFPNYFVSKCIMHPL